MTEAPQRPGAGSVVALALLGIAVFAVPLLFRQPGLLAFVDAPLRADGAWAQTGLGDLLAGRGPGGFAPVAHLSYRLDHALAATAGELAGVMHLQSALLHVLAAVVLLAVFGRLGIARHRALAGAALFLVHPAVVETTAVVAFRPAILAGLCGLLAIWAALRHGQGGGWPALVGVGLAAAAAVGASPLAVVLPVWAALSGVRRAGAGGQAFAVLTLAAGAVFAVGVVLVGVPVDGFRPAATLDPVVALVWPRSGAMVLGPAFGTGVAAGIAALVGLALLAGLGMRLRRSWPGLAAGLGLLVLAGLVGGAVGPARPDVAGYLALVGAGALLAAMPWPRRVTVAVATAAALAFALLDIGFAARYQDGHTLWGRLADASPVAATLYAAELAGSPLDSERKRAVALLAGALPQLPDGPDRLRALRLQIELSARLGQAAAASRAAEAACRLGERLALPADQQLALYLRTAQCFSVEDSRVKIDEYFGRARALAPAHPEVVAADAERDYVALVQALRRERADPRVDLQPGWLAAAEPRLVPILAALDRALAADAGCYRALVLRGRIHEATGGVLSAVPFYQRAIQARPERVEARILLASLYAANDQPAAAEACVQAALSAGLDDPALHYVLGNLYAMQGRRDDARRYLEAYVSNRPGNRNAEVLLANLLSAEALSRVDRLEVAELQKLSDRIQALNPDDPKGLLVQASVLCKQRPRDFVGAIVLLEKALAAMPGNPDAIRQLACTHRDYGWSLVFAKQKELAMDHFNTFLRTAPATVSTEAVRNAVVAHCRTLEQQGRDRLRAGEPGAAEAAFRRSAELLPKRPDPHYQLGITMLDQARPEPAISSFEKAVELGRARGEDISFFLLPLLDTLQRVGRTSEARQRGEAFLKAPGSADATTIARIRELLR